MSLSNVGLRKQINDFFFFNGKAKNYTQKDIDRKGEKCEKLFEELHLCV